MTRCRHHTVELVNTKLRGPEKELVAYCSDGEQLLTAYIDFRFEIAHIEAEPDPVQETFERGPHHE